MNYNNFSCRLIVPRLSAATQPELPPKLPPKKERKAARPRLVSVVSVITSMLGLAAGTAFSAEAGDVAPGGLWFVPAADTVAFNGFTGRLAIDRSFEKISDDGDLAARLDALTAQVSMLTATTLQNTQPANAMRLSVLTGVLLSGGLGVAIYRAGLLFRPDPAC